MVCLNKVEINKYGNFQIRYENFRVWRKYNKFCILQNYKTIKSLTDIMPSKLSVVDK